MPHLLSRFVLDESGVTGIEYALIASLISIVIIAGPQLSVLVSTRRTKL